MLQDCGATENERPRNMPEHKEHGAQRVGSCVLNATASYPIKNSHIDPIDDAKELLLTSCQGGFWCEIAGLEVHQKSLANSCPPDLVVDLPFSDPTPLVWNHHGTFFVFLCGGRVATWKSAAQF